MNAPGGLHTGTALERLLHGRWVASGLIETPGGRVRTHFDLVSQAVPTPDGVRVDEHYRFADARTLERTWVFQTGKPGHWQAGADDVVGTAAATQEGAVSHLRYVLVFPWRGRGVRLRAHDRLHPLPDGALLLRSTLRKWGVRVAELTAVYRTDPDAGLTPGGQR